MSLESGLENLKNDFDLILLLKLLKTFSFLPRQGFSGTSQPQRNTFFYPGEAA